MLFSVRAFDFYPDETDPDTFVSGQLSYGSYMYLEGNPSTAQSVTTQRCSLIQEYHFVSQHPVFYWFKWKLPIPWVKWVNFILQPVPTLNYGIARLIHQTIMNRVGFIDVIRRGRI